jgi:hypothetical protein
MLSRGQQAWEDEEEEEGQVWDFLDDMMAALANIKL